MEMIHLGPNWTSQHFTWVKTVFQKQVNSKVTQMLSHPQTLHNSEYISTYLVFHDVSKY